VEEEIKRGGLGPKVPTTLTCPRKTLDLLTNKSTKRDEEAGRSWNYRVNCWKGPLQWGMGKGYGAPVVSIEGINEGVEKTRQETEKNLGQRNFGSSFTSTPGAMGKEGKVKSAKNERKQW